MSTKPVGCARQITVGAACPDISILQQNLNSAVIIVQLMVLMLIKSPDQDYSSSLLEK